MPDFYCSYVKTSKTCHLRSWFGNNIAIRLVQQQDVRSTRSHDANGGDVNDDNSTGSSDNNRQRCNARFVFSSFVNLADLGRDRTT